jgi:hypothetical protein
MNSSGVRTSVLAIGAIVLAGCQSASGPSPVPQAQVAAVGPNQQLLDAGFVTRKATSDKQNATLAGLPPNKMVKQTVKGKVNYVYADPAGCGCVYVGSPKAYKSWKGMQNTMLVMDQQQLGADDQIDPGLSMNNIEDLGAWEPL